MAPDKPIQQDPDAEVGYLYYKPEPAGQQNPDSVERNLEQRSTGGKLKTASAAPSGDLLKEPEYGWKYGNEKAYQDFIGQNPNVKVSRDEFQNAVADVYGSKNYNFVKKSLEENYKDPKFWEAVGKLLMARDDIKQSSRDWQKEMKRPIKAERPSENFEGWKYANDALYSEFGSRFPELGLYPKEFEAAFIDAYWDPSNGYNDLDKAREDSYAMPGFLDKVADKARKYLKNIGE